MHIVQLLMLTILIGSSLVDSFSLAHPTRQIQSSKQSEDPFEKCAQGLLMSLSGQPYQALPLLRESVPQLVPTTHETQTVAGWCALILGTTEGRSANWREADSAFETALVHFEAADDWRRQAVTLNNWAMSIGARQQFEQALLRLKRVQELIADGRRRGLPQDGSEQSITFSVLNNLGTISGSLGHYDEAEQYLREALELVRQPTTVVTATLSQREQDLLEATLPIAQELHEATILSNLGGIAFIRNEYATARAYLQETLTIARRQGHPDLVTQALNNLGEIAIAEGNLDEALNLYMEILQILHGSNSPQNEAPDSLHTGKVVRGGNNQQDEMLARMHIGKIYDERKQYQSAETYYQTALDISRAIKSPSSTGLVLANLGFMRQKQAQPEQALDFFNQAIDSMEGVRAAAGSDRDRAQFVEQMALLYDSAVVQAVDLGQTQQAFEISERSRARSFLDSLATGQVRLDDAELDMVLRNERDAYAAHEQAQAALDQARAQEPPDQSAIDVAEDALSSAEQIYQQARTQIDQYGERLQSLVAGRLQLPSLSQLQAELDEHTALISFYVTQERTIAFVITRDEVSATSLTINRDDLLKQINLVRSKDAVRQPYSPASQKLYEMLFANLPLPATSHLTIIPHSILHYVPFAALHDGRAFLIDRYALTMLPSASTLRFLKQRDRQSLTSLLVLGVNDPQNPRAEKPLQYAEQEAASIARLTRGVMLVAGAATPNALEQRVSTASIIHIAAHGYYDLANPLNSGLYLRHEQTDDGVLTVGDVYSLQLIETDLVVLSACQTQINDGSERSAVSDGDELVGLTRAFFFAGASSVIATLWSVDDESTQLLMERFYIHLRSGMSKTAALRQAQIDLRTQHPEYAHPYYWSGFVLSGDPGDLDSLVIETTMLRLVRQTREVFVVWWAWLIGIVLALLVVALMYWYRQPSIYMTIILAVVLSSAWIVLTLGDLQQLLATTSIVGAGSGLLTLLLLAWAYLLQRKTPLLRREYAHAQDLDLHGRRFFAWFSGHHLLWAAGSSLGATGLLYLGGANKAVLVIVAGLLAISTTALIQAVAALPFAHPHRSARLTLCWIEHVSHDLRNQFRATLSLRDRYELVAETSAQIPESFMYTLASMRGLGQNHQAVAPIKFKPSSWTRFWPELRSRGLALTVPFLLAVIILAVLPLPKLDSVSPFVPISNANPTSIPPTTELAEAASPTPTFDTSNSSPSPSSSPVASGSPAPSSSPAPAPNSSPSPSGNPAPSGNASPSASPSPGAHGSPSPGASGNPLPSGNPSPATSGNPSPGASGNPSPGASGNPSPGASGNPSPAASGNPSPGASGNPSPGASGNPSPAASGSPGASGNPSPAASGNPSPAASGSPSPGASGSPAPGPSGSPGSIGAGSGPSSPDSAPEQPMSPAPVVTGSPSPLPRPQSPGANQMVEITVPALRAPSASPAPTSSGSSNRSPADDSAPAGSARSSEVPPATSPAQPAKSSLTQYIPNWIWALFRR